MEITYKINQKITVEDAIDLYKRTTLGERRPVNHPEIFQQMLDNANLTITAWDNDKLVGISRTLTDFGYVAYLADLAVDEAYQKKGIGKKMVELTEDNIGKTAFITLLAAPNAQDYYPKIGFETHPRAWIKRKG
ncbi:MAG TPA: GNAT family N-acetyltransferase [Ignavibacteriaceae bacterium]|nr:GNAT family N-acetyltransferase [Ignavibacteriaceae bacterium]